MLSFSQHLKFPILGRIIPNMGNETTYSISEVLFSGIQRKVLALLFGEPDRTFYASEIEKRCKTGRGALQRELEKLTGAGILSMTRSGARKHYSANKNSPIYDELQGIVQKTFGLADVLRKALETFGDSIQCAFVYGSIAKRQDSASSDIDVMLIASGLSYGEIFESLATLEDSLHRRVNPTLYSPADFAAKLESDNHFLTSVLTQPKIFLIGDESAIPKRQSPEPPEDREAEKRTTAPG